MVELVAEVGYRTVKVRPLSRLAGVSTRSFYEQFKNVEHCFAATHDSITRRALSSAAAASKQAYGGEPGVRAAIASLAAEIAANPKAAQLVLIESFAAGSAMRGVPEAIAGFESLVSDTFPIESSREGISKHLARGIAGGATRVIRTTLLTQRPEHLPHLTDQLGDWVVTVCNTEIGERDSPEKACSPVEQRGERRSSRAPRATRLGTIGDENARILTAVIKLAASEGYSGLSIPKIRAEAGVSRRNFDARFRGLEDCFFQAIEVLVAAGITRGIDAAAVASNWESSVARVVLALCVEIERNQAQAEMVLGDIFAPGRSGLLRCEDIVSLVTAQLLASAPPDRRLESLAAEASVGAAWRVAQIHLAEGGSSGMRRIAPLLKYLILASGAGGRNPAREPAR